MSRSGLPETGLPPAAALPWREATRRALYASDEGEAPGGFYLRERPGDHFRTSSHVSEEFAGAMAAICRRAGLRRVVDLGAGSGELLARLHGVAPELDLLGVELRARPPGLPAALAWQSRLPPELDDALVVANEWLDNVPVEVVELSADRSVRRVWVESTTGQEWLEAGSLTSAADSDWLSRWWPLTVAEAGQRAEVGRPRDDAWRQVVASLRSGIALAIDYAHTRGSRPPFGSLCGYRRGRQVLPVPDGTCDLTAHVALDACEAAGLAAGATSSLLCTQREALRALGVSGRLPDVSLAREDPPAYLAGLASASRDRELLDSNGLGGFGWLVQGVGVDVSVVLAAEPSG